MLRRRKNDAQLSDVVHLQYCLETELKIQTKGPSAWWGFMKADTDAS